MVVDASARNPSVRPRGALVDRHDPSLKPSSTSTNPSSSTAGGVAALRKRPALGDMTNGNRRVLAGSAATSEGIQSSGKDASSGAVSRGKLAVRDSNVSTAGAAARLNAKNGNGKPAGAAAISRGGTTRTVPQKTTEDRPVKTSKRATNVASIPTKSRGVTATIPASSRSISTQSTASQRPAVAATSRTAAKDDRVVKRVKTDKGEKRVTEEATSRERDGHALQHKKRPAPQEEVVKAEGPAKDEGWEDLDAEDIDDPLMVAEYVNDIFDYMKELEMDYIPTGDYIDKHPDITWEMRGVLVDWLIDIHSKFRLLPETLFLAQNIVDRFLSLRTISLHKLQLVGLTAMFIAAKYEEVLCPSVQNFLYLAEGGYTDEEILKAERYMLKVLKFSFSYANPMNFLRRISKADNYDIQTRTVAKFFMEISLVDHRLLEHPPSLIAAAAVWNARLVLERGEWTPTLVHYSSYSVAELLQTAELMLDYCLRPVQHQAFIKKYSGKKFMKSAPYVMEWSKKTYGEFSQEEVESEELLLDLFAQNGYERVYSVVRSQSERGSTAGPGDAGEEEEEQQHGDDYDYHEDEERKEASSQGGDFGETRKATTRETSKDPLRERSNQHF